MSLKNVLIQTCSELVSLSFSAGVLSQSSYESLHSWYEKKQSNSLDVLSPSADEFQDPYVVFLEPDRESIFSIWENLDLFTSFHGSCIALVFSSFS